MKLFLVLLFFVKFSFAYQLHNYNGSNITSTHFREDLYFWCNFNRSLSLEKLNDKDIAGIFRL